MTEGAGSSSPRKPAPPPPPSTPLEWVAATGAFLVELALVGTLGVAAYRLAGGGLLGWVAATVAAVALIAVWATWMAPRAGHRLPLAGRLALGCGLVLLVAGLTHASGLTTWAWWFGGCGLVLMAAGQKAQG